MPALSPVRSKRVIAQIMQAETQYRSARDALQKRSPVIFAQVFGSLQHDAYYEGQLGERHLENMSVAGGALKFFSELLEQVNRSSLLNVEETSRDSAAVVALKQSLESLVAALAAWISMNED